LQKNCAADVHRSIKVSARQAIAERFLKLDYILPELIVTLASFDSEQRAYCFQREEYYEGICRQVGGDY